MSNALPSANISLEPKLNLMAAEPLAQKLTDNLNLPVKLDASQVSHIDQPCLQILISAARQWHCSGIEFDIHDMSEAFVDGLITLGLAPSIFENREPE